MAIQVSGTQVIGNSRELTNISSVDATTATAIGNAGVGGSTSFLGTSTFTQGQTMSYLEYDLNSAYRVHIFYMNSPIPTTAWNGCRLRLYNNGTLETGNKYVSAARIDSVNESASASSPSSYGRILPDRFDFNTSNYFTCFLTVTNAPDTSRCTTWDFNGAACSTTFLGGGGFPAQGSGYIDTAQNNNKIRLYPGVGTFTANAVNFVTRYGVK